MNQLMIKKKNELTTNKKKGFTLVELIIVIAIIAILAAIAIPKFGEIRTNANEKADIATAKNIATVVSSGIANEDILLPDANTDYALGTVGEAGGVIDVTSKIDGGTTPKADATDTFEVTLTPDGDVSVKYATAGTVLFGD